MNINFTNYNTESFLYWNRMDKRLGLKAIDKTNAEKIERYKKLAEKSNIYAQYALGEYYALGHLGVPDPDEAFRWFKLSAEGGYAKAQDELSNCYRLGKGIEKDSKEAFKWLKTAEKSKKDFKKDSEEYYSLDKKVRLTNSNFNMDILYWRDLKYYYKDKSCKEKFIRYKKTAEAGNIYAQYEVASSYLHGIHVDKNIEEAVRWYKLSAEGGFERAQSLMSEYYKHGIGVEKDHKEAEKWYRLSKKQFPYLFSISQILDSISDELWKD